MFMFSSTHQMILSAHMEAYSVAEAALHQRIAELQERNGELKEELAAARMKLERMEIVLMPLSSAAGASYVAAGRKPPKMEVEQTPSNWTAQLQQFMRDADAEAAKAENDKIEKESYDGLQS